MDVPSSPPGSFEINNSFVHSFGLGRSFNLIRFAFLAVNPAIYHPSISGTTRTISSSDNFVYLRLSSSILEMVDE
jgi:hypothetical protein